MNAHDTFHVIRYCSSSLVVRIRIFVVYLLISFLFSLSFLPLFFPPWISFHVISYKFPRRITFNIHLPLSQSLTPNQTVNLQRKLHHQSCTIIHRNVFFFFNNRKSPLSLNAVLLLSVYIIEIH